RHRLEWLGKIQEPGVRRRAEFYYAELDALRSLRLVVRSELLLESKKHNVSTLLSQIPSIGPIRAALLIALLQTPDRFRTKRQLWAYSGLAIETHDSAENQYVNGQLRRQVSEPTNSLSVPIVQFHPVDPIPAVVCPVPLFLCRSEQRKTSGTARS
uniref:transposase n=1 Tax=Edaphobacter aggregans TaxID=570835 RepID=UPI0012FB34FC